MIKRLMRRFRVLLGRPSVERAMDDEMQHHIECETAERIHHGMDPAEARRTARRDFGGVERFKEEGRDARGVRLLHDLAADLRYALRTLRANPAFTWTAIISLALGIGANVAIFTLINGVLLRPLPFPRSQELYRVWSANRSANIDRAWTSPVTFADWRPQRQQIADMGGYTFMDGSSGVDLVGGGNPERLAAAFVTEGFFSTIGMAPQLGRLPREEELSRNGDNHVVVLGWALWAHRFGQSAGILDSIVTLNSGSYRVIGVMPRTFRFPNDAVDLYVPYATLTPDMVPFRRDVHTLSLIARGKPGTTLPQIRAEMVDIAQRNSRAHEEESKWDGATVLPLQEVTTSGLRPRLLVLGGAIAFLLLMACVNLASLLLARGARRESELAIRIALGASRWRVTRQLLTESLVIAVVGGIASVLVAMVAIRFLGAASLRDAIMKPDVQFDRVSMFAALGLSLLTTLAFGVLPAVRSARADPQEALRGGGRGATGSRRLRLRGGLVIGEIALAFVLVAGALLMAKTVYRLSREDLGFRGEQLVTATIHIDTARHPDSAFATYYQQVLTRLRGESGLKSVAAIRSIPLRGSGDDAAFLAPGMSPRPATELPTAPIIPISDGYFATISANVLEGREFLASDDRNAPNVAMVNRAFVRRYISNGVALDQTLLIGGARPVRIVGVVADIRQEAIDQVPEPTMYIPYLQNMRAQVTFVARATQPLQALQSIRRAIVEIDHDQALSALSTFDDVRGGVLSQPRTIMSLLLAFGLVGLALGATGVYGVLAYLVAERRREIGVRMALGAQASSVLRLVLRRGMLLAIAGVAIGGLGALAVTRALRSVLYGVSPTDGLTFVVVAVVLMIVTAVAGWVPARRAARISPLDAIRE